MLKLYHFIFNCFCRMVIWNTSDDRIGRAAWGMSFAFVNYFNALILFLAAYFQVSLKGYGYLTAVITLVLLVTFYYLSLKYFRNENENLQTFQALSRLTKNIMLIIGCILFFGSFLALGFIGKFYSTHVNH